MNGTLLQSTSAPGQVVLLLYFLAIAVSVLLSVVILAKGIGSYRRSGDPALLGMAAGILLLSGAPLLVNVLLANATTVDGASISVLTDLTRLCGLGLILYLIYDTQP